MCTKNGQKSHTNSPNTGCPNKLPDKFVRKLQLQPSPGPRNQAPAPPCGAKSARPSLHAESKVRTGPTHVRSQVWKLDPHTAESNADPAPHTEGSHTDPGPHTEQRHSSRDQTIAKTATSDKFQREASKTTNILGVHMTPVTTPENKNILRENTLKWKQGDGEMFSLFWAEGWLPLIDIRYIRYILLQFCVLASISRAPPVPPVHHVTWAKSVIKENISIVNSKTGNLHRKKKKTSINLLLNTAQATSIITNFQHIHPTRIQKRSVCIYKFHRKQSVIL